MDSRSFFGATLPGPQQGIILVLSFSLVCLWVWQQVLSRHLSTPTKPQAQCYVEVSGDIPYPGTRLFSSSPSLQEVWEAAGGRGILPDGAKLVASGSRLTFSSDHTATFERMAGSDLLTLGLAIDPNHATAADLEALPGIGPVLAGRIIEFRQEQGPFQDIADMLAVKGIGPEKLSKIKSLLVIDKIRSNL